eukprot:6084469-Pleurochrysis_carterae.AAC.6
MIRSVCFQLGMRACADIKTICVGKPLLARHCGACSPELLPCSCWGRSQQPHAGCRPPVIL